MYQELWVPSGQSGGWWVGGVEPYRFARVIAVQRFAVLLKGITMIYRTIVQWGNKTCEHKSWKKSTALSWMFQYPGEDILCVVKTAWSNKIIGWRYFN